jgi:hypothetical protein
MTRIETAPGRTHFLGQHGDQTDPVSENRAGPLTRLPETKNVCQILSDTTIPSRGTRSGDKVAPGAVIPFATIGAHSSTHCRFSPFAVLLALNASLPTSMVKVVSCPLTVARRTKSKERLSAESAVYYIAGMPETLPRAAQPEYPNRRAAPRRRARHRPRPRRRRAKLEGYDPVADR